MRTPTAAQEAVLATTSRAERVRVSVKDAGGTWRDLTTYPGINMLDEVTWREDADSPHMTCDMKLRRDVGLLSLAPLRSGSALNRGFDPDAAYAPLLAVGRRFKVEMALVSVGHAPATNDWMLMFDGYIDTIDSAGDQVQLGGRDLGGKLADAWFEKEWTFANGESGGAPVPIRTWAPSRAFSVGEFVKPSDAKVNGKFYKCTTAGTSSGAEPVWPPSGTVGEDGTALVWTFEAATTDDGLAIEDVMQSMLSSLVTSAGVTIHVPDVPGFMMVPFKQDRSQIFSALRKLALLYGGDIRFKYRADTTAFELTVVVVDRAPVSALRTFGASEYTTISRLSQDAQGIRNVVDVIYPDSLNLDSTGAPIRTLAVQSSNSNSITKYGRLWMELAEGPTSQIDTEAEAQAMAAAAVLDLCEPTIDHSVKFAHSFPFVELGDYYAFAPNDRHYDETQNLAVYAYEHTARDGVVITSMSLRGKPSAGRDRWHEISTAASPEGPHQMDMFGTTQPMQFNLASIIGGVRLTVEATPPRHGLPEEFEHYISETSGFSLSSATLAAVGSQRMTEIANLIPGRTYYTRTRPRSRNASKVVLGQPSAEQSFVAGRGGAGHVEQGVEWGRIPVNGGFETWNDTATVPDHWTHEGTWGLNIVRVTGDGGVSGAAWVRYVCNAFTSPELATLDPFILDRSTDYAVQWWAKISTFGTGGQVSLAIRWLSYNEGVISTVVVDAISFDDSGMADGFWHRRGGIVSAPSGAKFGRLVIWASSAGDMELDIDSVRVAIAPQTSAGSLGNVLPSSASVTAGPNPYIAIDATGGNRTVTMPVCASAKGFVYHVKKTDSSANTVTITPDGAELVDGEASYVLEAKGDSVTVVSDGSNWLVFA